VNLKCPNATVIRHDMVAETSFGGSERYWTLAWRRAVTDALSNCSILCQNTGEGLRYWDSH